MISISSDVRCEVIGSWFYSLLGCKIKCICYKFFFMVFFVILGFKSFCFIIYNTLSDHVSNIVTQSQITWWNRKGRLSDLRCWEILFCLWNNWRYVFILVFFQIFFVRIRYSLVPFKLRSKVSLLFRDSDIGWVLFSLSIWLNRKINLWNTEWSWNRISSCVCTNIFFCTSS